MPHLTPIPIDLFCTCSRLYQEAIAVCFSINRVELYGTSSNNLIALKNLPRQALPALRALHLRLNRDESDDLEDDGILGQKTAAELNVLCAYIASKIIPRQVRFVCTAYADDSLAAERIVVALKKLPVMKTCAVRLGTGSIDGLCTPAGAVVDEIMKSRNQFPFERLPFEIRSRILYFTDLVRNGIHHRYDDGHGCLNRIYITDGRMHRYGIMCCHFCTENTLCCCNFNQSSFSTTCKCSASSTELFRVSKLVSTDAFAIFYKYARFRLGGNVLRSIQCLIQLPHNAVKSIRHIEFLFFPQGPCALWGLEHSPRHRWEKLLHFLMHDVNKAPLTLHVFFRLDYGMDAEIMEAIVHMVISLLKLRGFRKVHVHVTCWDIAHSEWVSREVEEKKLQGLSLEGNESEWNWDASNRLTIGS